MKQRCHYPILFARIFVLLFSIDSVTVKAETLQTTSPPPSPLEQATLIDYATYGSLMTLEISEVARNASSVFDTTAIDLSPGNASCPATPKQGCVAFLSDILMDWEYSPPNPTTTRDQRAAYDRLLQAIKTSGCTVFSFAGWEQRKTDGSLLLRPRPERTWIGTSIFINGAWQRENVDDPRSWREPDPQLVAAWEEDSAEFSARLSARTTAFLRCIFKSNPDTVLYSLGAHGNGPSRDFPQFQYKYGWWSTGLRQYVSRNTELQALRDIMELASVKRYVVIDDSCFGGQSVRKYAADFALCPLRPQSELGIVISSGGENSCASGDSWRSTGAAVLEAVNEAIRRGSPHLIPSLILAAQNSRKSPFLSFASNHGYDSPECRIGMTGAEKPPTVNDF